MPKILVVGDLHGDWGSLNALIANKQPDIVMCCGDFGWWPNMEITKPVIYRHQANWLLRGIKPGKTKVYFCDGNHEQHPVLNNDGYIHEMYPNVYYCSRGSTLILPNGRTVLFAGGAESIDKPLRTPGHDWFPEETIKNHELDRMLLPTSINIVVSHTCPTSFLNYLNKGNWSKRTDPSCRALDVILKTYQPNLWFFGHWHLSKEGQHDKTRWMALDYPKHGGKWWHWLKEVPIA